MDITLKEAKPAIVDCLKNKLVPLITGQPGVGKSDVIRAIAKEFNLEVIDVRLAQCDPTDLLGLPQKKGDKVTYAPFDTFPLEGDELPEGKAGWLLFLDEIRNADVQVQNAAYKLVLDRMVGHHHLHDKCLIVAAGNREEDATFVTPMPAALKSRMVHLNVRLDFDEWIEWAMSSNIDSRITSFLQFKPSFLATNHTDNSEETYACPRTWEFTSRLIKNKHAIDDVTTKALIHGTVGVAAATEFNAFVRYYQDIPSYQEIVKNPDKAKKPENTSKHFLGLIWAIIGMIEENFNEKDLAKIVSYIEFIPREFSAIMFRNLLKRGKLSADKITQKEMKPFMDSLREVMFDN